MYLRDFLLYQSKKVTNKTPVIHEILRILQACKNDIFPDSNKKLNLPDSERFFDKSKTTTSSEKLLKKVGIPDYINGIGAK